MRVLVAGGTGVVGRHAALELMARGHEVTVLARRPEPLPAGLRFVQADLLVDPLDAAVRGMDAVVWAATTDQRILPDRDTLRGEAVGSVSAVRCFEAARAAGVERALVVTSAYRVTSQDQAREPGVLREVREGARRALMAAAGLRLSIVRRPFVIGPSQRPGLGALLARYVRSGVPLVAPPGIANFIAARSLAQAIASALERPEPARYLVGDENLGWGELFERFSRAAGRPRRSLSLPPSVMVPSVAGLVLRHGSGGFSKDDCPWGPFLASNVGYDASPAQRVLGYQIGNLDEAILACVGGGPTGSYTSAQPN